MTENTSSGQQEPQVENKKEGKASGLSFAMNFFYIILIWQGSEAIAKTIPPDTNVVYLFIVLIVAIIATIVIGLLIWENIEIVLDSLSEKIAQKIGTNK